MRIVVAVRHALGEADAVAVDQARRIALRRRDVEITALALGPAAAAATGRAALAHGADAGVPVGPETVAISRPSVYRAALPAVVSVTERCGEPRCRPFSTASRQPVRTWSLADLGLDDDSLVAATTVVAALPVARRTGTVIEGDPAAAAERVADFLAERQFL